MHVLAMFINTMGGKSMWKQIYGAAFMAHSTISSGTDWAVACQKIWSSKKVVVYRKKVLPPSTPPDRDAIAVALRTIQALKDAEPDTGEQDVRAEIEVGVAETLSMVLRFVLPVLRKRYAQD